MVSSAVEHRMAGLLLTRVQTGNPGVHPSLQRELTFRDMAVQAHHGRLWETAVGISHRLAAIDVEVAVAKGVPVEARWYDRPGERPCADLDLLIRPSDLHRVGEVVRLLHPGHPSEGIIQVCLDQGWLQSVDLRVDGVAVDLHVDVLKLGPPCRERELLWRRTEPLRAPTGEILRVLDVEASLLVLLIALNRDCFCRLLGFADVARLLRSEDLDWDAFEGLARAHGVEVLATCALEAVTNTLGLPSSRLSATGARPWVWRAVWRPSVRLQGDYGWVRHRHRNYWQPFLVTSRLGDAVRWLFGQLLLAPEVVSHLNPGSSPWLLRLLKGRVTRALERRRAMAAILRHKRSSSVAPSATSPKTDPAYFGQTR